MIITVLQLFIYKYLYICIGIVTLCFYNVRISVYVFFKLPKRFFKLNLIEKEYFYFISIYLFSLFYLSFIHLLFFFFLF